MHIYTVNNYFSASLNLHKHAMQRYTCVTYVGKGITGPARREFYKPYPTLMCYTNNT